MKSVGNLIKDREPFTRFIIMRDASNNPDGASILDKIEHFSHGYIIYDRLHFQADCFVTSNFEFFLFQKR